MLGKKKLTYYDYFKKAQKSEQEVINQYQNYLKSKEKYKKVYDSHLKNLSELDKQFQNFNSFQKSFKEMFKEKKDGQNLKYAKPLLLQNYDMIDKYYTKKDIIQFHLVRQFLYIIYVNFPPEHRLLVRSVDFDNIMSRNHEIDLIIKTVDGTRTTYQLQHTKYHINSKATVSQIKESLMRVKGYQELKSKNKKPSRKTKTVKKNSKKEYNILVPKSIKMVNKDLPVIPPLPGNKSMKSSKKIKTSRRKERKNNNNNNKKENNQKRENNQKKINNQKKELKDVNLPINSPNLPIFEIELPAQRA